LQAVAEWRRDSARVCVGAFGLLSLRSPETTIRPLASDPTQPIGTGDRSAGTGGVADAAGALAL